MKINKKIIRLKRFSKSICHCERSATILLALALVLSLGILTTPVMANIITPGEPTFDLVTTSHFSGATNAIYTFTMTNIVDSGTNEQLKQITATIPSGYTINSDYITTTAGTKVGTMTMSGGGDAHSADLVTTTTERVFTATYSDKLCGTLTLSGDGQTFTLVIELAVYGLARTQGVLETISGFFINPATAGIYSWPATALGYGVESTEQDCSPGGGYSQDVQIGLVQNQTTEGDYSTIQSAITNASSGDTINVAAGTYNEGVGINKPLTLQGEDRATTIIDGTGLGWDTENGGIMISPGATYDGKDVNITISGFTVQNFAFETVPNFGSGIATDGEYQYKGITISDVTAKDNSFVGIYLGKVLDSSFSDIAVENNGYVSSDTVYGYGIWVADSSTGNTFTNITATRGDKTGNAYGVFMAGSSNGNTFNNINSYNNYWGIYVWGSSDNTFNNINSHDNSVGILFQGTSSGNIVSNSTVEANNFGIKRLGTAQANEIHSSNIVGNTEYGVFWDTDVVFDATNNWWGDASGPTHTSNPGGTGDAVSDNVDFIPFLSPNVTITKTGPATANKGNNITYTITYKNVGTYKATGVKITENYPSEVEFVSATPAPDEGTNNKKWTINTLAPGVEDTITVTVHIK